MNDTIRLDKYLANAGIGSRAEVKKYIRCGRVLVNDIVTKEEDYKIDTKKDIVIANDNVVNYEKWVYLMLNKPQGYVSATVDNIDPTVIDLIKEYKHIDLFPVGRLDKDTEGLLLITNDGELAHRLTNPKYTVPKTYYVETELPIKEKLVDIFLQGIQFKDYTTMPAILDIIDKKKAYVTIYEGKFHQVKNMFGTNGNTVVFLKRIKFKGLELDTNLALGEYRKLTDLEVALLQNSSSSTNTI